MPEELQTVSPDQIAQATAIADDASVFIQVPGGPIQKVSWELLLAKLIKVDLLKADQATLYADLAHEANQVALVFNDADPLRNGWYRKSGASGAGAWTLFEQLSKSVREAAETARAAAEGYRNELASSVNQADSLRTALLTGVSFIGSTLDRAMMQALNGVLINIKNAIYRLGAINYSSLAATGAVTATRAAAALALAANGAYSSFGVNSLRVTSRGLLVEAAATQLLAQPVDFTQAAWTKTRCTAVAVPNGAPGGVANSYAITVSTTANSDCYAQTTFAAVNGTAYTEVLHLKKRDFRYVVISITGLTTRHYYFDFDTGTLAPCTDAPTAADAATVEALAGGVFRIVLTVTAGATATANFAIRPATGTAFSTTTVALVNGAVAYEISMAQVEAGRLATSPILTGAGTRPADAVALAIPAGSSNDVVTIEYEGGVAQMTRGSLANPLSVNLVTDGSGAWLGKYITAISVVPAFGSALVTETENGAKPYLVAMDGTYWWNGAAYASLGTMVGAIGASGATLATFKAQNYIAPDAVNLLAGTDFTIDQQGFTQLNAGAASIEGGYLKLTSTGPLNGALSKRFRAYPGKAFRFTGTVKTNGVAGGSSVLSLSNYGVGFQTRFNPVNQITGTTGDTAFTVYGSANYGQFYAGITLPSGTGDTYLKNPALYEVAPAKGWPQSNFMVEIVGTLPNPLPAATQVIWQADPQSSVDRIRLELRADGSMHLVTQLSLGANGQSADINLGSPGAGQPFRVVGGQNFSTVRGACNGNAAQEANITWAVGAAAFRIGSNEAGASNFTGTVTGLRIFAGLETKDWMKARTTTALVTSPGEWVDGDSFTDPGTGIQGFLMDKSPTIVSTGQGGSTFEQQYARLTDPTNLADFGKRSVAWWDGSQNGRVAGAVFTASIAGTTMTVTAVTSGVIAVDQFLSAADGASGGQGSVAPDTLIVSQLTSTEAGGALGGRGTYRVSTSQVKASGSINAWNEFVRYKAFVAALGHNRHFYIRSGQISPYGPGTTTLVTLRVQEGLDMDTLYRAIQRYYGDDHVLDPQPYIASLYTAAPGTDAWLANQSDITFGFYPRDVMQDAFHLNAYLRRMVAYNRVWPKFVAVRAL